MTVTEQAAPVGAAAVDARIAERLETKSVEQVIAVGERTGWWTADDVERVLDAAEGASDVPRVETDVEPGEESERLEELTDQLREDGAIARAVPPAEDVLAVGLAHPSRRVRQLAARAQDAVDELCTALFGGRRG